MYHEILILGTYDIHAVVVLHVNYGGFGSSSGCSRHAWDVDMKREWQRLLYNS